MENPSRPQSGVEQRLPRSALLIGFALGGFFDGILLHQVLQWHHLLSGVTAEAVQDLRVQVLADGLFHLLMYVVALAGLWMLWTRRHSTAAPSARLLWASAMVGFGSWHVLDAVVSHWLLGIHRVRMDSAAPLLWDLLWFFVFGVLMIAAGLMLRRRDAAPRSGHRAGSITASFLLTGAALLAGPTAAVPPAGLSTFVVVMRPGADAGHLLDGLAELRGGILWANSTGSVWAVKLADAGDGARLYRHGAMLVTSSPAVLGCAAWTRVVN